MAVAGPTEKIDCCLIDASKTGVCILSIRAVLNKSSTDSGKHACYEKKKKKRLRCPRKKCSGDSYEGMRRVHSRSCLLGVVYHGQPLATEGGLGLHCYVLHGVYDEPRRLQLVILFFSVDFDERAYSLGSTIIVILQGVVILS